MGVNGTRPTTLPNQAIGNCDPGVQGRSSGRKSRVFSHRLVSALLRIALNKSAGETGDNPHMFRNHDLAVNPVLISTGWAYAQPAMEGKQTKKIS